MTKAPQSFMDLGENFKKRLVENTAPAVFSCRKKRRSFIIVSIIGVRRRRRRRIYSYSMIL